MLEDQYISMKTDMCNVLSEQEFVASTTDAWSTNHKSYLGVTVHWIDSDILTISSGALACRRIKGRHTYDTLAEMLESVHMEFSIQNKVVLTTTDNGSNFVKAFSVFAAEEKVTEDDEENDEEADVEFTDVAAFLQETKKDDYHLAAHQRCACHSLHLVATKDAEAAVEDSSFKKISRAAFAKCQSLWNKQSRSTQASDNIKDRLGCMLVVPNVTRWNSTYNAMDLLKTCIEKKPQELHDVCEKMDIPRLKPSEITFIKEYVMVMAPVSKALDVLQSDTMAYLGVLVPTINILVEKLQSLKQENLQYCGPLVNAIISGVNRRFSYLSEGQQAIDVAEEKENELKIGACRQWRHAHAADEACCSVGQHGAGKVG
ncbi:hypothetical protein E1301_Tti021445 [Triplophysa tibetana]|uniref:Zinc finger BED domain-containing protein 4 n=1 Tax=Triplophysa tibetana TaxID=1572043 RepID=A0A5A9PJY1_9TELE|nr:hypothetical protein E1301_Tti021445 [Triplophysa tibetana]